MNWEMIGAIGEMVGAVAVVATLFYLASQIREASRESKSSRWGELNNEMALCAESWVGNTELSIIMYNGFRDTGSLESQELFRFYASLFRLFRAWETLFEYSKEGKLLQWGAEGTRKTLVDILGYPGVKIYWQDRHHWYSPSFQAEVDKLLNETGSVLVDSYARHEKTAEATP